MKWLLVALALVLVGCQQPEPARPAVGAAPPASNDQPRYDFGNPTKTSDCVPRHAADGAWLTDLACTPGVLNAVLTAAKICDPAFRTDPYRNVPQSKKDAVYDAYNIPKTTNSVIPSVPVRGGDRYEIDHVVSLEDGGSNDIGNLAPQPAEPKPGFHEKDAVETWVHNSVCTSPVANREATLKAFQKELATDWTQLLHTNESAVRAIPPKQHTSDEEAN